jgi:hypothetical protein
MASPMFPVILRENAEIEEFEIREAMLPSNKPFDDNRPNAVLPYYFAS